MIEGIDYIRFRDTNITLEIAQENYKFWKEKDDIPKIFKTDEEKKIFDNVKKIYGANTFASRKTNNKGISIPLFQIFHFNEKAGIFENNKDSGLKCDRILQGDGQHMGTARELGIDKFVFSYLGMHLPYHRQEDFPPVCPFGVFIKISDYAYTHGSPCDRDYKKNDEISKDDIDKCFLIPEDLQKVVTNRIYKDPLFKKDFWRYYGTPHDWEDLEYREKQWKKKAEYCFFEKISTDKIAAILWPVWEEVAEEGSFLADEFFELIPFFKDSYEIDIIIYRPYRDIINKSNWNNINQRDWEIALIEASYLAHKYFNLNGFFPDSILTAKQFFK